MRSINRIDTMLRANRWKAISVAFGVAACFFAAVGPAGADSAADLRVKEQIVGRLTGLVSIHPERLAVEVSGGVVKLTGSVASIGEKLVVARVVGSVTGVASIENDLSVRTLDRPEALIVQEVNRLLQNRPKFRNGSIQVSVAGSEVTLNGKVKHNADRADAEEIAGTAQGVTNVLNRLTVDSNGNIPDETIKSRVTSALVNPVTFGVIRNLEVEVVDGTVTLKGTVRRASDRGQAERITQGIEGVDTINNMLTVEGS